MKRSASERINADREIAREFLSKQQNNLDRLIRPSTYDAVYTPDVSISLSERGQTSPSHLE